MRACQLIKIKISSPFFTNKTFGYSADDCEQTCDPEQCIPNRRRNQVSAEGEREIADQNEAQQIQTQACDDGFAPEFEGEFFLEEVVNSQAG